MKSGGYCQGYFANNLTRTVGVLDTDRKIRNTKVNPCVRFQTVSVLVLLLLTSSVSVATELPLCGDSGTVVQQALKNRPFLKVARSAADNLAIGDSEWPVDGQAADTSPYAYNRFFGQALGGESFEARFARRKAKGKPVHVADFFGSGVYPRELKDVDTITGIRLQNLPVKKIPDNYPDMKWDEVLGDLFLPRTWAKIRKNMRDRKIPGFDIITLRPEGPLTYLFSRKYVLKGSDRERQMFFSGTNSLLRKIWKVLSPDQGELYVQITQEIRESPEFNAWLKSLHEQQIEVGVFHEVLAPKTVNSKAVVSDFLKIVRTPASPTELPTR
jgi:hypothetical protein